MDNTAAIVDLDPELQPLNDVEASELRVVDGGSSAPAKRGFFRTVGAGIVKVAPCALAAGVGVHSWLTRRRIRRLEDIVVEASNKESIEDLLPPKEEKKTSKSSPRGKSRK